MDGWIYIYMCVCVYIFPFSVFMKSNLSANDIFVHTCFCPVSSIHTSYYCNTTSTGCQYPKAVVPNFF